jgi:hypothetical protein
MAARAKRAQAVQEGSCVKLVAKRAEMTIKYPC